ncbi:MAG TPA: hypothetical protein VKA94_03300, partial [Hyphomicrobiales bacterium]|nr:hypothetical protein [Hyphomicrobiales bacterium]
MRLSFGAVAVLFMLAIQPANAQKGGWVTGEVTADKKPAGAPGNKETAGDPAYDAFDRGNYIMAQKLAEKQAANGVVASNTLLGML